MQESPSKSEESMPEPGSDMKMHPAYEDNDQEKSPSSHESEERQYEELMNQKEGECQNLKDSLAKAQERLSHIKEQNSALMSKYQKAQEEILTCQGRLAEPVDSSQFRVKNYQLEMKLKEDQALGLKSMINEKTDRIVAVSGAYDLYKDRSTKAHNEIEDHEQTINELKEKVKTLEEEIDALRAKRKVEGTAFTEVERLRADNERLVQMLNTGKAIKPTSLPKKEEWKSQDAFKLARDILHKNNGVLNEESMNSLLVDLNKIWQERGNKEISRLKQKYGMEVASLRREGMMKNGFDEVDAKKEISRLKSDLNGVYSDLKRNIITNKKNENNPQKTDIVGDSLKQSSKLHNERERLRNENERLKAQVKELKEAVNVEGEAKAKYMEGAIWMGNAIATETDKFAQYMERLRSEYTAKRREKDARGDVDPPVVTRLNNELVNGIESAVDGFKAAVHGMKGNIESQERNIRGMVKKGAKDPEKYF